MIYNHVTRDYSGIVFERMKHLPPGGKMGDLPEYLRHESFLRTGSKKTGGPNMRLLRLEMDRPSLTVTAYIFNKFVHPSEDRYITPREAACLQDFPDDWIFQGGLGEVHHQVGNAVPVRLAKAIGKAVAEFLARRGVNGDIPLASYFCGAGGFDIGFEQASESGHDFKTVFATDIDQACGKTITLNRPQWNFFRGDITKFSGHTVLDRIGVRPVVVIGGPPCQTFSVAGKQKATTDPLGTLYRNYLEHVAVLSPEIVVMENVYGLTQVRSSYVLGEIYHAFGAIGYSVKHLELLAADYGTPQMRRRLIFVAAKGRNDFVFPVPTHSPDPNVFGKPLYNGAGHSFAHLPKALKQSHPLPLQDLGLTHL